MSIGQLCVLSEIIRLLEILHSKFEKCSIIFGFLALINGDSVHCGKTGLKRRSILGFKTQIPTLEPDMAASIDQL